MARFLNGSAQECKALFSQANTTDIEKWMFVLRIASSDSTETQTESFEVATCWTPRYNKDEVFSKATCLVARD